MISNRHGFTLVELIVVIGIMAVLAAVTIAHYRKWQHRAKRAEMPINVDGIMAALLAEEASSGRFVEEPNFQPRPAPDKQAVPWTTGSNFDRLAWVPDGRIRAVYKIDVPANGRVNVEAESDVDGDLQNAKYHIHYDFQDALYFRHEYKTDPMYF